MIARMSLIAILCLGDLAAGQLAHVATARLSAADANVMCAPVVADSLGNGAAVIAVVYGRTPDGYVPTFHLWQLKTHGHKVGGGVYRPGIKPLKYREYPFLSACRCPNGDVAFVAWAGHCELIRLDSAGQLVYTRMAGDTPDGPERFSAVSADRDNGLWLGATSGKNALLYHLDERGNVLLQKEYSFAQYTGILDVVQTDSDDIVVSGLGIQGKSEAQVWIMRATSEGVMLRSAAVPVNKLVLPGHSLVTLPEHRSALLLLESVRGEKELNLYMMDKDLQWNGRKTFIPCTKDVTSVSMTRIGDALAVVKQGRSTVVVMVDSMGRIAGSQTVPMVGNPSVSAVGIGRALYVAGQLPTPDGSMLAISVLSKGTPSKPAP